MSILRGFTTRTAATLAVRFGTLIPVDHARHSLDSILVRIGNTGWREPKRPRILHLEIRRKTDSRLVCVESRLTVCNEPRQHVRIDRSPDGRQRLWICDRSASTSLCSVRCSSPPRPRFVAFQSIPRCCRRSWIHCATNFTLWELERRCWLMERLRPSLFPGSGGRVLMSLSPSMTNGISVQSQSR